MPLRNPLRRQLAATSPITLSGFWTAGFARATHEAENPCERLDALLQREFSVSGTVLTGSGTEALVLAFEAAEHVRSRPTTVVLPAFSCFDVAAAAARFGRPVVFYDVDPHTLGPDLDSLAAAVRGADRTVLIAPLFGVPIDWRSVDPLLADSGAVIIEDAAQGHGARWRGVRLGGHGRFGILSFGRGKGWTGGGGGALLIRDREDLTVADRFHLARTTGRAKWLVKTAAHWALGRPGVYGLPHAMPGLGLGETHYRAVSEPRAMVGSAVQLVLSARSASEKAAEIRTTVAAEYERMLADLPAVHTIHPPVGSVAGYVRFPVLLPHGMASFADPRAAARLGASASYPAPLPTLAPMRSLVVPGRREEQWKGATTLVRKLVTLPTHALTTASERRRLVSMLNATG